MMSADRIRKKALFRHVLNTKSVEKRCIFHYFFSKFEKKFETTTRFCNYSTLFETLFRIPDSTIKKSIVKIKGSKQKQEKGTCCLEKNRFFSLSFAFSSRKYYFCGTKIKLQTKSMLCGTCVPLRYFFNSFWKAQRNINFGACIASLPTTNGRLSRGK